MSSGPAPLTNAYNGKTFVISNIHGCNVSPLINNGQYMDIEKLLQEHGYAAPERTVAWGSRLADTVHTGWVENGNGIFQLNSYGNAVLAIPPPPQPQAPLHLSTMPLAGTLKDSQVVASE